MDTSQRPQSRAGGRARDLTQACVTLKVPRIWPARWAQRGVCPPPGGSQGRRTLALRLLSQIAVPRAAHARGPGHTHRTVSLENRQAKSLKLTGCGVRLGTHAKEGGRVSDLVVKTASNGNSGVCTQSFKPNISKDIPPKSAHRWAPQPSAPLLPMGDGT